jgi:hypothetical protein
LGDDPLGHDAQDPYGPGDPAGHDLTPDLGHEPAPGYADGSHEHFGAAGDVYPDDDPFTAGHHDDAVVHDDTVVHDDVVTDHGQPGHDDAGEPAPDHHQFVAHPVGADPDLDRHADAGWHDPTFPPPLDLHDAPEPIDGFPWSDPQVLGSGLAEGTVDDYHEAAWQHPSIGDLYDYAGDEQAPGADGWQGLLGSDDPAASTLARWWAPGT